MHSRVDMRANANPGAPCRALWATLLCMLMLPTWPCSPNVLTLLETQGDQPRKYAKYVDFHGTRVYLYRSVYSGSTQR